MTAGAAQDAAGKAENRETGISPTGENRNRRRAHGRSTSPSLAHGREMPVFRGLQMGGEFARVYAARSGKSVKAIRDLMIAETWLTGDEAVALGLADEVEALAPAEAVLS